jgi:hypothetical protein
MIKWPFSFLCGMSLLLTGCSDNLSNGKAEQLIKQSIHFPVIEDEMIETGLFTYERDSLPPFYYNLQRQGLFKIESLGKGGFLVLTYRFRVTPTPAAKPYITVEDSHPVKQGGSGEFMYRSRYNTCEVYFQDIESVQEIPSMNTADVQFRVQRKNFTPFWSIYLDGTQRMPDSSQVRPFKLIKTNDGWKADH